MTEDVVNRSAPAIEDVLALSPLQEGLFSLAEIAGDDLDLTRCNSSSRSAAM